jgi:molybdopterin-synthase adenylyltransferase
MKIDPREDFTPQETERYSRNALLAQVGWEGQARWRAGRVLVVGAGGIGSAALLYLAAAGVGRLGLVDGDAVELSNLQRQILHQAADLGRRKVESAGESLSALNPLCQVETFDLRLNPGNIREVVQGFEVVLDASDNFITHFLLAECCWRYDIPLVSAAATGWHGQLLVAQPAAENPCYRCLVPEMPPAEAVPASTQIGILGAVAGAMGCLQAAEALKLLLGLDSDLTRRLLAYDGLQGRFQSLQRIKRADCPLCGNSSKFALTEN